MSLSMYQYVVSAAAVVVMLVVQECGAAFYPPVFWHSQNCVFRQLKESYGANITQEYFMKVLPYNALNIVCPNRLTVNDWLGSQFPDGMYENLWMVDRYGFDHCRVNHQGDPKINKRILVCDKPNTIKYALFRFHNSYNSEEPKFAPGHHYYFISTSKGEVEDLSRRSGGNCKSTHMKLHIYVCDPKTEDCIWEIPRCDPPYKMMRQMTSYSRSLPPPTRAPVPVNTDKVIEPSKIVKRTTQGQHKTPAKLDTEYTKVKCIDEDDEGTSVHLILNFVLGGVILFMAIVIIILACGLARKSSGDKNRPSSVTFSHLAQEPSAHLYEETARFVYPPITPISRSLPQTPLTNTPFYLPPMSEIRARAPSTKSGFNNSVYNQRRHSHDGTPTHVEASPKITEQTADNTAEAV